MLIRTFCCLLIYLSTTAQSSKEVGTVQRSILPNEAFHFHTDKEMYLPGDTVWFKVYLMERNVLSSGSTILYANFFETGGAQMGVTVSMPIANGVADGSFVLPDSIDASSIIIQAFTHQSPYTYTKQLPLFKSGINIPAKIATPSETLALFPEGGTLINDVPNYIAFKAATTTGIPYALTGELKSTGGTVLEKIETQHDGMGIFKLIPNQGVQYFVEWKNSEGVLQQTPLPISHPSGIAMHVEEVGNLLYYIIQNPAPSNELEQLQVTALLHGEVVYRATLKMSELTVLAGKIPLVSLPPGVLQLTVSNKNNQPLAERVVFVNKELAIATATLAIIEKSTLARGKNIVEINVPNSLQANLSLSVFDATFASNMAGASIYSDLLLTGNLRGYIHCPAWYFSDTTKLQKQGLDLLMLTYGWRKYRYDTTSNIAIANYLSVKGSVTDLKDKLLRNEAFTMIVSQSDSTKNWYQLTTDQQGRFVQGGLIFYDTAHLFFRLRNPDKMKVVLDKSQSITPSALPTELPPYSWPDSTRNLQLEKVANAIKHSRTSAGELENVTVKGYKWRTDHLLKMDEKYTSGPFRGGAVSYSFDVMNDPMRDAKLDIYNYMFGKVPRVDIKYEKGRKKLTEVDVYFIDESEVDIERIDRLDINSISYIKYIRMFPGRQGFPKALCIYLKKGDDWKRNLEDLPSNLLRQSMMGFTPIKEFYAPEYLEGNSTVNADVRTILYWQPYIELGKGIQKVSIPFYNNDISKRLKIVLEGVNEEGRLISVEKMIE